ncbi:MAG: restriction endonuclease subunit S [Alphaproteobacteria bacterium]
MGEMLSSNFEDICLQITDGTHDSPKLQEYGVPFIKGKHISNGYVDFKNCDYITYEDHLKVIARSKPEAGNILFSNIGSVGDMALIKTQSEFSIKNVALIKANTSLIDHLYLYYYMLNRTFQNEIKNKKSGSAQPFISLNTLRKHVVTYHKSRTQQRKIAGVLSSYDDLIENNNRRIKILEEMAQKLYKHWFVDFKFPNHENTKFVDSPLGKIPEGWVVKSVIDCCTKIQNGGTPKRSNSEYWTNATIPWLTSGEVRQNMVIDTKNCISEIGLKESSAKLLPKYVTIVALYGATAGQVAFSATELTTNQAVCALFPKTNHTYFNYLFLKSISEVMVGKATGAAQQNISKAIIEKMDAIIPKKELLEDFENKAQPIFYLLECLNKQNQTLTQTRDMLLPRLIAGEVSVENLEVKIP